MAQLLKVLPFAVLILAAPLITITSPLIADPQLLVQLWEATQLAASMPVTFRFEAEQPLALRPEALRLEAHQPEVVRLVVPLAEDLQLLVGPPLAILLAFR